MKIHARNLLIALGSYVAVFVIIFAISMNIGIIYFDNPEAESVYILSLFLVLLFSIVCYLVFFILQRKRANKSQYAAYLSLGERLAGGMAASIAAAATALTASFLDYLVINLDDSLFFTWRDFMVFFLIAFVIINFVCFIFLKPRP